MIEMPCTGVYPHGQHGWVPTEGLTEPLGTPEFRLCLGVAPQPDIQRPAPERANREGDTQALPVATDEEDTQSVAMRLIDARRNLGILRYGQALQPGNGRDSLQDAVEEALDMYVYLLNYWRELHPGKDFPA